MNVSLLEWIEMPTYRKINTHDKILVEAVDFLTVVMQKFYLYIKQTLN